MVRQEQKAACGQLLGAVRAHAIDERREKLAEAADEAFGEGGMAGGIHGARVLRLGFPWKDETHGMARVSRACRTLHHPTAAAPSAPSRSCSRSIFSTTSTATSSPRSSP